MTSLQSTVTTLNSDVSSHDTRIDTLENAGYATTASLNTGLSGKVDTTSLTNYPTTASVLNLLSAKVDTTTLTNYYTTNSGLNTLLHGKVDSSTLTSDYTSSTALATLLAAKQNTGNYLMGVQVGTVAAGSPAAVTATTSGTTTTLDFTLPSGSS